MAWGDKPVDILAIAFGLVCFLLIRWVGNTYVTPYIDNLEWRKELRAAAAKVQEEGVAADVAAEAVGDAKAKAKGKGSKKN